MARHREKLTITEPVHPTTHGKLHTPRLPFFAGHHHHHNDDKAKTKTIPLGVHFTGPRRNEHADLKQVAKSKSRSLESSPEKTTGAPPAATHPWLSKQRSADDSHRTPSHHSTKVKFPEIHKSASWAHFVEASSPQPEPPHLDLEVPEPYVCDMSCLFLGHKFASGNHTRLYQGVYMDQDVAVKLLRLDSCEDSTTATKLERQFMQEVHCLSQLHHPNIVKFMAASWKPPVCCLIMEYVPGGSLRAFLHRNDAGSLSIRTILSMALDVANGMEYLHSQGVVHRDLKSENLVLTDDLHLKLTDFGVGCLETECDLRSADTGTYRWMAPEMISHQHYSKKVDVYSFGVVLWELVTGRLPFEDMTPVQVAYAVVNKSLRPPIPESCPAPLRHLMERCWIANPERRPSFYQIVQTLEDLEDPLSEEA
jgi:tRNA A-37 threonylcarbamoyl transferase component Bud32